MRKQLTEAMVTKLAPPVSGRLEIHDALLPWLALRVTPNGAKSYVVRGRVRGQPQPIRVTVGDARLLTLADARQTARDTLLAMRRGEDPREEKKAKAASVARQQRTTFAAVAQAFIRDHVAGLRTSGRVAADIERYLVAPWDNRPIASITADDISEVIQAIVEAGKPAQAHRVLATAKRLFRWACAPARPRDERLTVNPTVNLSAKDFGLKPQSRQMALSNDHLRAIWTCAGALSEPWASYFRMLLLSGQRRSEVAGMCWSELDIERDQVWNIPAIRMKAKRPHEIPLSPPMLDLIREQERDGAHIFGRRLSVGAIGRAKARLDKLMAEIQPGLAPWQIHDIRRAVRTGLGAIPSIPHDIRELTIGHTPPALVATYDLHGYRDEKRQALTLWAERLARIIEPPPESNVVRIAR
jgi:integrase